MSEQELKKWESKFKFWMVMNGMSLKDIDGSVNFCRTCPLTKTIKCIQPNDAKEVPLKLLWVVPRYMNGDIKIELCHKNRREASANPNMMYCAEWIKHV